MLFDVAAISSVALGPVAEAFGVHETARFPLSYSVPGRAATEINPGAVFVLALPDAPPVPFIGPATDSSSPTQSTRLLRDLSIQPASRVSAYLTANRTALLQLLASPPPPTEVSGWWASLGSGSRAALASASPELVGNLDGIPYRVRDSANRSLLSSTIASLQATIGSDAGRTVVLNAKDQLRMLQSISAALGSPTATPRRTLMTLDVTGQGKAAIVMGDLSTADYVTYLVPGMFFTIENQMGDWVDAAANLYVEQRAWLALLRPSDRSKTVATVAWIGYHTPNLTNVGGIQNAEQGRDALAKAIEGLQTIRAGNEPFTTVVAHSYGSTAALMALTKYSFRIDALAMVGSPGSPAKSVRDLHVRAGNVWVGEAAWDPIPNSSYFGSDPGATSYGANPLGVGGGLDPLTSQLMSGSIGHNEYFNAGTESMRNFALIGINEGQYVTSGH